MMIAAAILAHGLTVAFTAAEQESGRYGAVGADQVAPTTARVSASQIQRQAGPAIGPAQSVDRSLLTPSPIASRAPIQSQLTVERGRPDSGVQLAQGQPSAGPTPSAAARSAGRNLDFETPDGPDRCDPRAERLAQVCARVIETRAQDFPAPSVEPLSPEQRLLVAQRELPDQSRAVSDQTRRLGAGRIDEDNIALAVASMSQSPSRPAEDDEPAAESAVADAIVSAVVSLVGGPTP